jgi:hypothetical protein
VDPEAQDENDLLPSHGGCRQPKSFQSELPAREATSMGPGFDKRSTIMYDPGTWSLFFKASSVCSA